MTSFLVLAGDKLLDKVGTLLEEGNSRSGFGDLLVLVCCAVGQEAAYILCKLGLSFRKADWRFEI
jgi:hypothetical protein